MRSEGKGVVRAANGLEGATSDPSILAKSERGMVRRVFADHAARASSPISTTSAQYDQGRGTLGIALV